MFFCKSHSRLFAHLKNIQCSPFITLCFGSIGMDHVISELCYYKGKIFQMSYGKMTIS